MVGMSERAARPLFKIRDEEQRNKAIESVKNRLVSSKSPGNGRLRNKQENPTTKARGVPKEEVNQKIDEPPKAEAAERQRAAGGDRKSEEYQKSDMQSISLVQKIEQPPNNFQSLFYKDSF